jgi:uncharacterized cupredoxin-like copper-binding protein
MRTFSLLILLTLGSVIGLGCSDGGSDPAEPTITVNLTNFAIEPSSEVVSAGNITVEAIHEENHAHGEDEGGATHQLLIARLADGEVSGNGNFEQIVLNLEDIGVGESKTGEVELQPGTYEFACLILEEIDGKSIDHYALGMHATFRVE